MSGIAAMVAVPHGRVPPHNLDAERSLLGGILLDGQAFNDVVGMVSADEFYRDAHRKIFEAMSSLQEKSQPIDRITLKDALTAQGAFEAVGGDEFIDLLDKFVPTAANLSYYAKIVHEKAIARRLIEAASAIAQLGYEQHGDVADFADECERRIFSVTEQKTTVSFEQVKPVIARVFKNIEALYERQEEITGIPTGFADLDRLTSGFQPADLVILAARPSMGKTACCLNIATHVGVRGMFNRKRCGVGIFSLEGAVGDAHARVGGAGRFAAHPHRQADRERLGEARPGSWGPRRCEHPHRRQSGCLRLGAARQVPAALCQV
jgi:replicative DNA helicase